MEHNNKINSTLLGFNANSGNDGACFEFLFNKSLGNGKQYINADITAISGKYYCNLLTNCFLPPVYNEFNWISGVFIVVQISII